MADKQIEVGEYTTDYVKGNIREGASREGLSLSNQILELLAERKSDGKKGFIDAKTITSKLQRHPSYVIVTLKRLREKNKVDFRWVKSPRSDRSLVVYRDVSLIEEITEKPKETTTKELKATDIPKVTKEPKETEKGE